MIDRFSETPVGESCRIISRLQEASGNIHSGDFRIATMQKCLKDTSHLRFKNGI